LYPGTCREVYLAWRFTWSRSTINISCEFT